MSIATIDREIGLLDHSAAPAPMCALEARGAKGRLRDVAAPSSQRNTAVAMHLSPLSFFIIGPFAAAAPLVLWLMTRSNSPLADDHGRETTNVMITAALAMALALTGVGVIVTAVWFIVYFVSMVRGAAAASSGEYFRYPMTLRFIH